MRPHELELSGSYDRHASVPAKYCVHCRPTLRLPTTGITRTNRLRRSAAVGTSVEFSSSWLDAESAVREGGSKMRPKRMGEN